VYSKYIYFLVLFVSFSTQAHRLNQLEVVSGNYERITKTSDLPKSITERFIKKGWCTGLGEYGEPFNESDRRDPKLPCSRLITSGKLGDYVFVYFESNGRTHYHRLTFYKLKSSKVEQTWSYASTFKDSVNFDVAIKKIEENNECFISPEVYLYPREIEDNCMN